MRRRQHKTARWQRLRLAILDRDGWRCQKPGCGKAGQLEVHHVDHDSSNDDPTNLVTWCRGCHVAHHRPARSASEKEWDRLLATMR